MNRRGKMKMMTLALLTGAGMVAADPGLVLTYLWDGGSGPPNPVNNYWDNWDNWMFDCPPGETCNASSYPDDSLDDAYFVGGDETVELVNVTIRRLKVASLTGSLTITFESKDMGAKTLTVSNGVRIGGSSGLSELVVTDNAKVTTQ